MLPSRDPPPMKQEANHRVVMVVLPSREDRETLIVLAVVAIVALAM